MLSDILTPDLFAAALRITTPLALAAIGGTICERAGVVNIALEGMMLGGAFTAVLATYLTGNPILGVVAAMATWLAPCATHSRNCKAPARSSCSAKPTPVN